MEAVPFRYRFNREKGSSLCPSLGLCDSRVSFELLPEGDLVDIAAIQHRATYFKPGVSFVNLAELVELACSPYLVTPYSWAIVIVRAPTGPAGVHDVRT